MTEPSFLFHEPNINHKLQDSIELYHQEKTAQRAQTNTTSTSQHPQSLPEQTPPIIYPSQPSPEPAPPPLSVSQFHRKPLTFQLALSGFSKLQSKISTSTSPSSSSVEPPDPMLSTKMKVKL